MRKKLRFLLLPMIIFMPAIAWAAAGDGLSGTAHDFSGIGTPQTGACTFCHTPHKAQEQTLLWNHTLSTNNFSWGAGAVTTAGTSYPSFQGDTYKGATAKCLSCHDGSVAVGDIGWWNGGNPGVLLNTLITGANQIATDTGDMTGNHPVAMPYPFNNVASTYNGVTTGSGIILPEWQANPSSTSNIRIFNDDGSGNISAGGVNGKSGIECSSCHDPHNGTPTLDIFFLRAKLGGSTQASGYICLQCHIK